MPMFVGLLKPLIGPIITKLVDRIPDPNERARAKEEAEKALIDTFAAANIQQSEINKIEAQHTSLFVAGWRPFIGWTCGASLAYCYIIKGFLDWGLTILANITGKVIPPLPVFDPEILTELVIAMLGLGGLRTVEKWRGVSRERSPKAVK